MKAIGIGVPALTAAILTVSVLFFLLRRKQTPVQGIAFIWLFLMLAMMLARFGRLYFGDSAERPDIFAPFGYILGAGPCFYLYFRAILRPWEKALTPGDIKHFAPFLVTVAATLLVLAEIIPTADIAERLRARASDSVPGNELSIQSWDPLVPLIYLSFIIQYSAYLLASFFMLSKQAGQGGFEEGRLQETLHRVLAYGAGSLVFSLLITGSLAVFRPAGDWLAGLNSISITPIALLPVYFAVRYSLLTEEEKHIPRPVRYGRSGMKQEDLGRVAEQLERLMDEQRPFLDEKLSAQMVSNELKISKNHLSQVLNEHYGRNFYAFINDYRVREAKRLLSSEDNRDESVLAIAFASGFNSKSAFQYSFKKSTGMTPTEYRKTGERVNG